MRHSTHHGTETAQNVDLTRLAHDGVLQFFGRIVDSGLFLLHGSNVDRPSLVLEARQPFDVAKASGNRRAVYATANIHAALIYATFNREHALRVAGPFLAGEHIVADSIRFRVSPNLYSLFLAHDPDLFRDGFVSILNRSAFVRAERDDPAVDSTEYFSTQNQAPVAICRVAR